MTVVFWLVAALMVLTAVALVWVPLGRRGPARTDPEPTSLALHRARLAELDADRASGALDPAAYEAARAEIAHQALLDERQASVATPSPGGHGGRWSRGAVLVLLPAVALGLYVLLGPDLKGGLSLQAGAERDPAQMVAQLEDRLAEDPDNGAGWLMLARSYFVLERHEAAVQAYQRARSLLGDEPALLADYAEAATMAQGGNMAGLPARLLDQALQLDSQHPKALWLGGLAALQAGDADRALARWTVLREQFPEGSEPRRLLSEQLDRLEARTAAAPSAAAVTVQVRLAPELAERVQDSDTVFVYARAANGPAMPLAAARYRAGDLPFTVRLDGEDAVMPGQSLAEGQAVVVVARVSKGGNAQPQAGDVEGRSAVIEPGGDVQPLVIDRVVGE